MKPDALDLQQIAPEYLQESLAHLGYQIDQNLGKCKPIEKVLEWKKKGFLVPFVGTVKL